MKSSQLKRGDWMIYRKQKFSSSPGPRAKNAKPAPGGDTYAYVVEKFWVVQDLLEDGEVRLCTRKGKVHVVDRADPRLRRPWFWERWILGARFRAVAETLERNG